MGVEAVDAEDTPATWTGGTVGEDASPCFLRNPNDGIKFPKSAPKVGVDVLKVRKGACEAAGVDLEVVRLHNPMAGLLRQGVRFREVWVIR